MHLHYNTNSAAAASAPTSSSSYYHDYDYYYYSTVGGHGLRLPSGFAPGNATQHAASAAIQRHSVCECCHSVSPPNDPSKNRSAADRPTAALGHTSVETRISVNVAARVGSPPTTCTWTTNDDLRLRWRRHATIIGGS